MRLIGAPPTLEWIACGRLQVDERYQRATESDASRRIIFGMVKCWDWRLCQPLAVSRRVDGSLFVVDGQHRLAGANERGDIPHLPCVVTQHEDHADEAHTFIALNLKRQKLNNGDVFNAMLAAGDQDARRVADLVERAGLSFARHSNTGSWKAGQIFCGPMLVGMMKAHGENVVSNALVALGEAYQGKVVSRAATLLKALILIYLEDAKQPGFDPDRFINALGSVDQGDWPDNARDVRKGRTDIGPREALAIAFMEQYDALREAA